MPFVTQEHRDKPDLTIPGDLCYLSYKSLVDAFRANRRWTNAHNLTRHFFKIESDEETANFLAWMVWFIKEVMPYEDEKEAENGKI